MLERDKFAFAALGQLLQSDRETEACRGISERDGITQCEFTAEVAYSLGDAMFKEALKRAGNLDEFSIT